MARTVHQNLIEASSKHRVAVAIEINATRKNAADHHIPIVGHDYTDNMQRILFPVDT